jgi:hypothetical protein
MPVTGVLALGSGAYSSKISIFELMRKFLIIGFFGLMSSFGLFFCGLHDFSLPTSERKMVEALQEALVLGSRTAAKNLGDSSCDWKGNSTECATGYLGNKLVEIAVPDTVKNILDKINTFTNSFTNTLNGLNPEVKSLVQSSLQSGLGSSYNAIFSLGKYGDSIKVALNRGAEKAAPQSVEVFKEAIFGMGFTNARGILMGNEFAATTYLHNTTYSGLQTAFSPIIKEPLDFLKVNDYWKPIAQNYKAFAMAYSEFLSYPLLPNLGISVSAMPALPIPYDSYINNNLPDDLSTYLSTYATGKALDGLFYMVGTQESKLRADPLGAVKAAGALISDTVGDLLVDVFGKAKNNAL